MLYSSVKNISSCNLCFSYKRSHFTPEEDEEQLIMRRMRNLLSSLSVVAREEITPEEDEEQLIMHVHARLIVLSFSGGPRGDHT